MNISDYVSPHQIDAVADGLFMTSHDRSILSSPDARAWARFFKETCDKLGRECDEDWMVTWFANAMMAMYDSRPKPGWESIATAPKDGTPVMLYFPKRFQGKGGISWGLFIDGSWLDSRAIRDNDASHWMPMPDPPPSHSQGDPQ